MALVLLLLASTRSSRLSLSYSASWMETVSATAVGVLTTCEGVALGSTAVGVLVDVGTADVGVTVAGRDVAVGGTAVEVRVGVGAVTRLITNERTADHAPLVPLAVRPRTRHQNVRSLLKVWVVWVCVIPVRERTNGELKELESSIWI